MNITFANQSDNQSNLNAQNHHELKSPGFYIN